MEYTRPYIGKTHSRPSKGRLLAQSRRYNLRG